MTHDERSFSDVLDRIRQFHGYLAPGVVVGAYMTEKARSLLPEQTQYCAICETAWCFPDSIQILTGCTVGNGRLKVFGLGLCALSLYDRQDGRGHRVWIDRSRLDPYPELKTWFLKLKPKQQQDSEALMEQIREAGSAICRSRPIVVRSQFLTKRKKGKIAVCPICDEAYPKSDGGVCRFCQGEAPYEGAGGQGSLDGCQSPGLQAVSVEEAVGKRALHDMTLIVPGVKKGAEFRKGQEIRPDDISLLERMGRKSLFVEENANIGEDWVHENEVARAFGEAMAGEGVSLQGPPSEGKVTLVASRDGFFSVEHKQLESFNLVPDVMCACRNGNSVVKRGAKLAGTRAIPLCLQRNLFERAMSILAAGPLFRVAPMRQAKVGILITGNEVFEGTIDDRFEPIISSKVRNLNCDVVGTIIAPDDRQRVRDGLVELIEMGADLLVTTAGLSVDPDDVTRHGVVDTGATEVLYGAPILPGAMTLLARIGNVPVIGVPACALFFRTTSFDLLLPRLLAGAPITRRDLAELANGAMCHECKDCTYPKCCFGK